MNGQILVRKNLPAFLVYAEETMTKLVLETVTALHRGADSCQSAAVKSLRIEMLWKTETSTETIREIT